MSLNGTSTLISGKIAQSKARGKALVEMLSREYGNEESGAAKIEGTKRTKYGKK